MGVVWTFLLSTIFSPVSPSLSEAARYRPKYCLKGPLNPNNQPTNRLGGLSLPRKSVVRLTDHPDMTLDVYRGRKTTLQQYNNNPSLIVNRSINILFIISGRCHGMMLCLINYILSTKSLGFVVVAWLFYVHSKHLRSCRDGQLT